MVLREVRALKPGMVLAKPACSSQGALLIREQTPLNERSILVLKSWGVPEVWVEGEEKPAPAQQEAPEGGRQKESEAALKERFTEVIDHQAMQEVLRVACRLRYGRSEEP